MSSKAKQYEGRGLGAAVPGGGIFCRTGDPDVARRISIDAMS